MKKKSPHAEETQTQKKIEDKVSHEGAKAQRKKTKGLKKATLRS